MTTIKFRVQNQTKFLSVDCSINVLSGQMMLERSTNWLIDHSSNFFDHLPQLKDGEWLNGCPKLFDSNHHSAPEFYILLEISF